MEKPRVREMYGIWSCIGMGAYGVGWNCDSAIDNWYEKYKESIISNSKNKTRPQRFG